MDRALKRIAHQIIEGNARKEDYQMMSKEELNKLKEDVANIQERLRALTDEELEQVFGGGPVYGDIGLNKTYNNNLTVSFENVTHKANCTDKYGTIIIDCPMDCGGLSRTCCIFSTCPHNYK